MIVDDDESLACCSSSLLLVPDLAWGGRGGGYHLSNVKGVYSRWMSRLSSLFSNLATFGSLAGQYSWLLALIYNALYGINYYIRLPNVTES